MESRLFLLGVGVTSNFMLFLHGLMSVKVYIPQNELKSLESFMKLSLWFKMD